MAAEIIYNPCRRLRIYYYEASCGATHEAGLRPMKRAFGTWFGMAALRFPSASFMHANVPFSVCSLFIPEKFLQLRKNS